MWSGVWPNLTSAKHCITGQYQQWRWWWGWYKVLEATDILASHRLRWFFPRPCCYPAVARTRRYVTSYHTSSAKPQSTTTNMTLLFSLPMMAFRSTNSGSSNIFLPVGNFMKSRWKMLSCNWPSGNLIEDLYNILYHLKIVQFVFGSTLDPCESVTGSLGHSFLTREACLSSNHGLNVEKYNFCCCCCCCCKTGLDTWWIEERMTGSQLMGWGWLSKGVILVIVSDTPHCPVNTKSSIKT